MKGGDEVDDVLIIRYCHGTFTVNMQAFFPATQKDIKTLFTKVIREMVFFKDQGEAAGKIISWMENSLDTEELKKKLEELANSYYQLESDLSDQEACVAQQKEAVAALQRTYKTISKAKEKKEFKEAHIEPAKRKLESLENAASWFREEMRESKKAFNDLEKREKKLRENLSLVKALASELMP